MLAKKIQSKGWRLQVIMKKPQQSLKNWTKQKWRTKSGKPSTQGPKLPGALSARESYQGTFGQRVCRYYESQAESD
jgi:hypothetical protein